ncbi:MAG TPA: undecaprenyldiphospho-muramoylpentapeptide beta-N-acetylglucosaminyltransferase [Hyphomicrobiaceae bacterium]|nr:undecaprenyldiphospho-muramoylpentapeptide beta-N-acetylglucosaminyltransferase [Hyphomicrobiaceae bacterium]
MNRGSVILAAGGTGGHLFPALALAEELARRGIPVDLVTDMRGDRYGADFPARSIFRIRAATPAVGSPLKALAAAVTLLRGIGEAFRLLGKVRPAAVVGFGGYPSFPPLVAARLRGVPAVLHEQNAVLGRANRVLVRMVARIATSFREVRLLEGSAAAKACLTGNPVRSAVLDCAGSPYHAPLPDEPLTILVFGGSQGARVFADVVPAALARLTADRRRLLKVVQQCRPEDLDRVRAAYIEAGIDAELATFFSDLPQRMAAAHLVVSRSGASTVAELAVIGRPAILVPLPHALDNDQLRNATTLERTGGAWCIPQAEFTPERLADEIERLASDPERLARAAAAVREQGRPDAVVRLADLVEELMRSPSMRPARAGV